MSQLKMPVTGEDHVQGPRGAFTTLVEYADFECPHCGRAHQEMKRLERLLGRQLRFVLRHFPLSQLHPHALLAAEAAEAAAAQGRFWQMADQLFDHQEALDEGSLASYAEAIGLDLDRFTLDLLEHRQVDRVRRDFIGGARSGVHGTPTFFLDGEHYADDYSALTLVRRIEGDGHPPTR